MKKKFYLGGAITGAPQRILEQHRLVAEELELRGHEVYLPHRDEKGSRQIYQKDLLQIREADYIVANVGWPSTGLGIEMRCGQAPVIAFALGQEQVSLFVLEFLDEELYPFRYCADVKSAADYIEREAIWKRGKKRL